MENGKKSVTLTIGWILLLIVGLLMALSGLESVYVAYRRTNDVLPGAGFQDLAKLNPSLPDIIRGRRATAASLGVTCGMLLAWISATAYRRGEKWAWWALLCSVGLGSLLSILRVSMLSRTAGAGQAGVVLGLVLLALAISYRDFK